MHGSAVAALVLVSCGSRTGLVVDEGAAPGATSTLASHACPYVSGKESGAPWPMKGRCADHDSLAAVLASAPLKDAWTFEAGDIAQSPVIGADGTIYVGAGSRLLAVAPPGVLIASVDLGDPVWDAPALADDGTIYVVSKTTSAASANLSAVRDGAVVWTRSLGPSGNPGAPEIGPDGTIYVAQGSALVAFAPDGTQKWSYAFPMNATGGSAPAIAADGTIYVTLGGEPNVIALDAQGSEKWRFDIRKVDSRYSIGAFMTESALVGADGGVYVCTGQEDSFSTVFALDANGAMRWTHDFGSPGDVCFASPASGKGGSIVFVNAQGTVASFAADGTVRWTFELHGSVQSSPAVSADGTVIVPVDSMTSPLFAISDQGALVGTFGGEGSFRASSPAIAADGRIVVGADNGVLHAIGK